MDVLGRLLTGGEIMAGTPAPDADFWYEPAGMISQAGIRVDADGAMKIGAWFRGRDLLATALAMLPLSVYQRLPDDGGPEAAPDHPLYDVLHRKPDDGIDSFTFRRERMYDLIDHGWGYAEIVPGPRGFADKLRPVPAKRVTPEQIKSGLRKGRWLFHVRDEVTGQTTTRTQDEMFYLRGASGKGILEYARDSLGVSMATESYAARVFSHGTLNSGIIETPTRLDPDTGRALAQSFKTAAGDWHMPKVLPAGAKWHAQDALTPEKAQMLLSRKFSINDIARWLGLPPHMLADLDRATFSNIEHQGQEFVTYSLGPWLSLWEFSINDQLILAPRKYYAEFTRDALVRGDIAARWAAYQIAVQTGTVTRNEVRRKENMKALPGLDTPLDPAHLTGNTQRPGQPSQAAPEPDDDEADALDARALAITTSAAARLLRKEIAAVQRLAVRYAADEDGFVAAVAEFYAKHAALVEDALQVSAAQAADYCAGQANQIVNKDWIAALEFWQSPHYAAGVAAMALEAAA